MPRRARRRPPVRHSLPPRPASPGTLSAPSVALPEAGGGRGARLRTEAAFRRDSAYVSRELRRIALVTGGAGGIGRAVAQRLAAEGAHVVVADLDAAGARKVAEEIVGANGAGRALGLGMDVTSEASVRAAFEEAVLGYGGVDIVVSNAGTAHSAPVDRMELADWERSRAEFTAVVPRDYRRVRSLMRAAEEAGVDVDTAVMEALRG